MILFNEKVFDRSMSGAAVQDYTDASLNEKLAQAEKWSVFVRSSQPTGTPTVTISLQHSNDNVNWIDKTTMMNQALSTSGVGSYFGADDGSTGVPGAYVRLSIVLSGSGSPGANLQIWLCGRSHD